MPRENWGSSLGFIMSVAGSAVGLGSLWRFPYIVGQNGGAIFVISYIVLIIFVAMPLFLGEIATGRRAKKSSMLAFEQLVSSQKWRFVGVLCNINALLVLSYYSVVSGWCLSYILLSLVGGYDKVDVANVFDNLVHSGSINVFWLFIFVMINWAIVSKGIKSGIEAVSKILMPALFVMTLCLLIYGMTLPGFHEAYIFVFYPKIDQFTSHSLLNALGMALFTLSAGLGILISYGSYLSKEDSIIGNGVVVTIITILVSLASTLTIFPIVFTFGLPPAEGPGLIFKTIPILFNQLPATMLISIIFFFLLFFAALTSTISLWEVGVANMVDFGVSRRLSTMIVALAVFIFSIPSALAGSGGIFSGWQFIYGINFFDSVNYLSASWVTPIIAFSISIFIGWKGRIKDIGDEITSSRYIWLWSILIKYLVPLSILVILLFEFRLIKGA